MWTHWNWLVFLKKQKQIYLKDMKYYERWTILIVCCFSLSTLLFVYTYDFNENQITFYNQLL